MDDQENVLVIMGISVESILIGLWRLLTITGATTTYILLGSLSLCIANSVDASSVAVTCSMSCVILRSRTPAIIVANHGRPRL